MSKEEAEIPSNSKEVEADEEDPKKVKVLELGIGENNKDTSSLIAMEMDDSKKIGYRKVKHSAQRKKSIDHIFGKMSLIDVDNSVDKTPLKHLPRRSLLAFDPAMIMKEPAESDDEEKKETQE